MPQSNRIRNGQAARSIGSTKFLEGEKKAVCELLEERRLMTGTWTKIAAAYPSGGAQMGVVLTDGTIMVHGGSGGQSTTWYKLTPSSTGSYINGTWSAMASNSLARLYTATQVLTSGKVWILGGEYTGSSSSANWNNSGEIYDPVANSWTNTANFPQSQFGDDPTALLPDGRILAGYLSGAATYIYNPLLNTWTATGSKLRSDRSDEESWVTLADHSILSYDVFSSVSLVTPHAQRYIPSTGTWVDAGSPPAQLSSAAEGYELGPGLALPDGRVFFAGATAATAYYTPSTNTWAAGPVFPGGYVSADAAGAVLPNGNLLLVGSPPAVTGNTFPTPTKVFELDPTTNIYTDVTPVVSGFSTGSPSYTSCFLVLPTGQIAMMNDSGTIAVYTESGSPLAAAVPVITGISYSGTTGVYTLSGTNLNGINEGAAYGDDNEMSSNYPLVRLTDAAGVVTYARTSSWSLTGISQGAETVSFTVPSSALTGPRLIQSVANGVASNAALVELVNTNSTSNVTLQMNANPASIDVLGGSTVLGTFAFSAFNTIYLVGDNAGDTLNVNLAGGAGSVDTIIQAGTGTDTININQTSPTGRAVILPSTGNDAVNVGTVGAATAIAQFLAAQQIGVLTIGNGGKATVVSGTKKLIQANGVVTTGTGVLDLTNNDMIIHGGNLPNLTGEIGTGFNIGGAGGLWNGPGIRSAAAATNTAHLTALGILLNNSGGNTLYGTGRPMGLFDGQSPLITDVLIKYTYLGDTNLDGHVDGSDYANLDNGFLFHSTGWTNGDFNYDNVVNGSDYTLMDNTYNTQGATIAATIAATPAITAAVSPPSMNGKTIKQPLKTMPNTSSAFSSQVISIPETKKKGVNAKQSSGTSIVDGLVV